MVNDDVLWTQIPSTWQHVAPSVLAIAKDRALTALGQNSDRPVVQRLLSYYDIDGDYAGATFAQMAPTTPDDITAADLHATRLLNVPLGAGATRRLLFDGPPRSQVLVGLRGLPSVELSRAGAGDLEAMEVFYLAIKASLSAATTVRANAWVAASKLCARKRPELFPVRDAVVTEYLDLARHNNYQVDWQAYRYLIGDREVIDAIDDAMDQTRMTAGDRHVRMDTARLRVLDAALWTYAPKPRRRD